MKYYPEKREEILSKRLKAQTHVESSLITHPFTESNNLRVTPLDTRLQKLKQMESENKQKPIKSRADLFLESEENQKKYGFRTTIEDGIRCIYYDGDIEVLNEAMYGPIVNPDDDPEDEDIGRTMSLSYLNNELRATIPGESDSTPVTLRIGVDDRSELFLSMTTNDDRVLTQLHFISPAYYPDEDACQYLLDLNGLSALNEYLCNNWEDMIVEWNHLHPTQLINYATLPNYRYLGSVAYRNSKKK